MMDRWMDRQTDRQMDGWRVNQLVGWMDGQMCGQMDEGIHNIPIAFFKKYRDNNMWIPTFSLAMYQYCFG